MMQSKTKRKSTLRVYESHVRNFAKLESASVEEVSKVEIVAYRTHLSQLGANLPQPTQSSQSLTGFLITV